MNAGACQAQLVKVFNHDLFDFTFEELLAAVNAGLWSYAAMFRTAVLEPMDCA